MKRLPLWSPVALTLSLTFLAKVCLSENGRTGIFAQENADHPAFYTEKVQPVLQTNCYRCHGGVNHRGGLNIESREAFLKGGHHGPAIVPGHPEQSLLVKLIRHEGPTDDPMNMPPDPKPKLSDADIAVVETWIKAGAIMPATPTSASVPAPGR